MNIIDVDKELLSARRRRVADIAGLERKKRELEEKIAREKREKKPDEERIKKMREIRDNLANILQKAR